MVAAQEGAENLTLELQSYSKKGHDHPYLPLSGGELTNTLTGKLIKSVRSTGYAFEAKPDNGTTTASISTDGSAKFKGSVKVDGTELAKVDHTHAAYAAVNHTHAKFRWTAVSHQTAENLGPGEFFVHAEHNIYFHPISADGINLSVGDFATETDINFMCSVHELNGNSHHCITANQINFNNSGNKYIRIRKYATHYSQSLKAGTDYFLNIPGFTY